MAQKITPKRGEIYLVNFDPAIGSEIKKTRPALIIQNNIANRYSPVTIVAALTSKFDELYPTEVLVGKNSIVQLNQIRTIDRKRLVKRVGVLSLETMDKINRAIEISLELIEI